MNDRLGVLPFPEHPRVLQTQTGHSAHQAPDAAGADGQALRPGQGVGQPVPVPLEVPELRLADPSALPARPPAPDPLRDGPDDRVGGAGHHEPPHAVQPHGREPTGAGGTDGPGSARLSQLFEFAPNRGLDVVFVHVADIDVWKS